MRTLNEHRRRFRLPKKFKHRFDEEIRFFRTWVDRPKELGAILPTSDITARKMASLITAGSRAPVLELGPGTGCITKAILARGVEPQDLYSVEFTGSFVDKLQADYPGVNIIHGDAFRLDECLPDMGRSKFDTVISAIPLLNFPKKRRVALMNGLFDRLAPGRPVVQISYGPQSPLPPDWSTYTVEPLDWIARNLPPARLWVYRRILAS